MAVTEDLLVVTTQDLLEEKRKLRKDFGRLDIFFFLICTLVGVDTLGAVASVGAQSVTWLIVLAALFFVPYALLVAELGTAFPAEGGPYVWTRLAFGRLVASVDSLLYWVSNPIWVGGLLGISALTAIQTFFDGGNHLPGPQILGGATVLDVSFVLAFIWFTVVAAIISFRIGKWIPIFGAFLRIFVLGFFAVSVLVYAIENGVHPAIGGHDLAPTYGAFIAAVPVLFFNYVGFELPSAAGEEMTNPRRDVPFSVLRSAAGTILLYGVPILLIVLLLPASKISGLSGFLDAIKSVFVTYGGRVTADGTPVLGGMGEFLGRLMAIAFVLALLSSGTAWIMGADRTQAIAALDGAAPRFLGTFSSRFGTPIVVNLLSGVVSTAVMILAFSVTGGDALKYFDVVLGLAISTTTISYLAIFPALIRLRYSHRNVTRPYRLPGGLAMAWIVGLLCTFWALLATIVLVYPGFGENWFGQSRDPNDALPPGFTRFQFELSQAIPLSVFFLAGIIYYLAGTPTRRRLVQAPITEQMGSAASNPVIPQVKGSAITNSPTPIT